LAPRVGPSGHGSGQTWNLKLFKLESGHPKTTCNLLYVNRSLGPWDHPNPFWIELSSNLRQKLAQSVEYCSNSGPYTFGKINFNRLYICGLHLVFMSVPLFIFFLSPCIFSIFLVKAKSLVFCRCPWLGFVFILSSVANLLQNLNLQHAPSDPFSCDSMFPFRAACQIHKIILKYEESV
jgi:hypothetical protein